MIARFFQTTSCLDLVNAKFVINQQPLKKIATWGQPKFKSKKALRQGFKNARAKIINGKLRLDKFLGSKTWYDIKFKDAKNLEGELKVISIYRENGKYWAHLPFEIEIKKQIKTGKDSDADVKVRHLKYTDGKTNTLPDNLKRLYKRIKYYQRKLARKRVVNGLVLVDKYYPSTQRCSKCGTII